MIPTKLRDIFESLCKKFIGNELPFHRNWFFKNLKKKLIFQSRIESINLPSLLKKICKCAFSECIYLGKVEFSKDEEFNTTFVTLLQFLKEIIPISLPENVLVDFKLLINPLYFKDKIKTRYIY